MEYENLNLDDIVTPVKPQVLRQLLKEANYDEKKTEYLCQGFSEGFDICYEGPQYVQRTAPNLKLRVGSHLELWNKVMVEVRDKRFAGPFEQIPFDYFIQSPIGLVPKDKGKKTRLIFHLLYARTGDSVNSGISKEKCSVKYPDFTDVVKLCLDAGRGCFVAKSDMSMAFRNVPLRKGCWQWLVMMAVHPITKKKYYFVDKCLPFGSSISCAIFQDVSNAVTWIVIYRTKTVIINYLDDYFLLHSLRYGVMSK